MPQPRPTSDFGHVDTLRCASTWLGKLPPLDRVVPRTQRDGASGASGERRSKDMQISRIRLSDKTSRFHPRLVAPKRGEACEAEVPVKVREWIGPALASRDL